MSDSSLQGLRRRLFPTVAGLLLVACHAALPEPAVGGTTVAVIPAPARIEALEGNFRMSARTQVSADDDAESRFIAGYFTELVRRTRRWELPLETGASVGSAAGSIAFRLKPDQSASPESYSLTVLPDGVSVSAADRRGLFYGAVTLWQLTAAAGNIDAAVSLPAMRIFDAPRFSWRGVMLDSARHFQSPEFIERFIDWMALNKLNVLHWHLTDDQAWRLEIGKYPQLTQLGAWRVPAGPAASTDINPATGKPRLYGGYYSQETVRRIVRYASERNIMIVPEIEMPGHATAALVAYPRLAVDGHAPKAVPGDWGIYPNLFNVEDETFGFIEDVLGEVIALFPGEYIHVGGDEAVKDQWTSSPRVRQRMRELGVADERALQGYFVRRVGVFLSAHGRRLIGWDEILEGGLPPEATVMSWRGVEGAQAAAESGHDAVLSPWPILYFDNRQGAGAMEPPGRGRIIRLEDVYRFDPLPAGFADGAGQHILGVQANLWTEHMRTESRVEWMAIPRAAALAEVGWSPPARRDFVDFRDRLATAFDWYRLLGYGPADTAFLPPPNLPASMRRSQELRTCSDKLVLNLEDDAPILGQRAIFLVDIMEPCWIFEGADLSRVRSIAATVGQFPFNFQIGKDRDAIRLRPPQGPDGELEVRIDGCDGERIAVLPLAPALASLGVTRLPPATIAPRVGHHDLCLTFTGGGIDPMWAIDSIELVE